MLIDKKIFKTIILGSTVLGTGGGGNYEKALDIVNKIKAPVLLVQLSNIADETIIISIFGVGGLRQFGDVNKIVYNGIQTLKKLIKKEINYLIPVEIGPSSLANTFYIASQLGFSVVDADIVGYRASPEVFLETITLRNVNRCPLVAGNSSGDFITLNNIKSPQLIEKLLRDFSVKSNSKIYVVGYPMKKKVIDTIVGKGSLSYSLQIGKKIESAMNENQLINLLSLLDLKYIGKGMVIEQKEENNFGFTSGKLKIVLENNSYIVYYKNENIILTKNGKTLLTCPDSIILIDLTQRTGINNGENNINKMVLIFGKKAIPIWRSQKGKQLFSPKNIGYQFSQKLL